MKSRGVPFWLAAWSAVIALTVAFCSIAPPWPEPPPPVTAAQAQRPPTARPSIAPGAQPTIGAVVQPRPTAAAGPNPAQIAAAPTALPTLSEVTLGSIS